MNNFSTTGYKDDSPDKDNTHNIIPGRNITMQGVSKSLTLIPIVNGKPQYDRKRVAKPGDPDIEFEDDVEGVLELPYAQVGTTTNPYNDVKIPGIPPVMNQTPPMGLPVAPQMMGQLPPEYDPNSPNAAQISRMNSMTSTLNTGDNEILTDPNDIQQAQAAIVSERQRNNKPFMGAINPYGGWNMQNASTALGAFIEAKNPLGIVGSAGKILLEGTRNALSGAAALKAFREGKNEYETELEEQERRQGLTFQKGGTTNAKMLTGNFIEGNDDHSNPNTEVEKGEYLQTPDGATMEVLGDRHSTGGELLNLPGGTKVISDYLKIGAKLATFFKKEFDLNVKSTSTFASVLDKYKKKIGLTELLEDETKLMDKLEKQEEVEFEGTREINSQVLSEKINELQDEKKEMEGKFEMFTNIVFDKQEETKEPGQKNFEKQEGGSIDQQTIDEQGNPIPQEGQPQQGGGSELEQIIMVFAQMTGQDPAQIIAQLQQLPEDQLQQAVEEMIQAIQQGQGQEQPQPEGEMVAEEPMMQKGGHVEYAQAGTTTGGKMLIRNPDGSLSYVPTTIPQGKSVFGAKDIAGEVYNPASDENITSFLDDARTTNLWNSDYNVADLENKLKNAKTPEEKFKILNTEGQKSRQAAFLKNAPEDMASYVGMGYAPVQTQLQKAYNSLPDSEKKNFEKVLKESGWGIEKGKVFGGNYKYNSNYKPGDKLFDYLNTKLDPKIATEIGIQNINDGVYDRRRERFETAEFDDEKSMSEFATKNGFKTFKDKLGRDVWVDPNNRNNIILPKIKGADTKSTTDSTDTSNLPDALNSQIKNWDNGMPLLVPNQDSIAPNLLQPGLRTVGHVQANAIKISPEETIRELNRQYSTASTLASETNPYTSGAMQADLQAKTNSAINQAYSQAAIVNAQDERNVQNINEERIQNRDITNIGAMNNFEMLSQKALDNYGQSWRNFYDKKNIENVNNYNLQQQVNASNAVNDNYKIGAMGEIYQTGESPIIYFTGMNGQPMAYNNKTKETYELSKTNSDGSKEKKKKETETKKKGGLLLKGSNFKKYLK